MQDNEREVLEKKLETFVGLDIGAPDVGPDAVNDAMIRHWCDAMGDENPVYTDVGLAIPIPGVRIVLRHAVAFGVHGADMELGKGIAALGQGQK